MYALNWAEYGEGSTEAEIIAEAGKLESWLAGQTVGTKPIFVISHMPLHYASRVNGDDNCDAQYGKYLFDVLNAAGQRGLNIIFLHGHNHSGYYDNYMGGTTVFAGKGETLWLAYPTNEKDEPTARTLYFTYMNAGYVGQIGSEAGPDSANTMSVFAITGDDVTITRYDTSGVHDLQAYAGVMHASDANNGYTTDRETQTAPHTVYGDSLELVVDESLSTGEFHVGDSAGVSVKNLTSGSTYSWSSSNNQVVTITNNANGSVSLHGEAEGNALIRVTETNADGDAVRYTEFYVYVFGAIVVESDGIFYQLATQLIPGKRYVFADSKNIGTANILIYQSGSAQGDLGKSATSIVQSTAERLTCWWMTV